MATYLSLHGQDLEKCLLCSKELNKREKYSKYTPNGWTTVKEEAERWSKLNVPVTDEHYLYTTMYERIKDSEVFGHAHKSCRTKFTFRLESYEDAYGNSVNIEASFTTVSGAILSPGSRRRSEVSATKKHLPRCFICNSIRTSDRHLYREGGIARCCEERSANRIWTKMQELLSQEYHRYYESAMLFKVRSE